MYCLIYWITILVVMIPCIIIDGILAITIIACIIASIIGIVMDFLGLHKDEKPTENTREW